MKLFTAGCIVFFSFAAFANHNNCENMETNDGKVNCRKLNRIEQKLDQVIYLLGNGGGTNPNPYPYPAATEFSCNLKLANNIEYYGVGSSIVLARDNAISDCTKSYTESYCSSGAYNCKTILPGFSSQYECNLVTNNNQTYKGFGDTAMKAKVDVINLCKKNYTLTYCISGVKSCKAID